MQTKNRLIGIGILTLTVILLLNAGTLTAQKTEDLQLELVSNTDQCLIDCEAVFKVTAPQDITLSKEDISIWFEKKYGHETDLSDFKIEMLTEKEEYVEVPKTKIVEEALTCDGSILADGKIARCVGTSLNGTKSGEKITLWETEYESYDGKTLTHLIEVPDGTELKPVVVREYEDYADKRMGAGTEVYFRVTGKRTQARTGPNSVDWKINLLGNQPNWAWWSSSWTKKAGITITYSGSTLTNYQMPLNISYDSDMKSDFSDLRFTNEEENTELHYYIESKSDSHWAYTWVEVDSIDSSNGTQAYMYYGDSSASSSSNCASTFLFCDEFTGSSLDSAKWTTVGSPTVTVSDGILQLTTSSGSNGLISKSDYGLNTALRSRQKKNSGTNTDSYGYGTYAGNHIIKVRGGDNIYTWQTKSGSTSTDSATRYDDTSYHLYDITRLSGESKFYRDGTLNATLTTNIPTTSMNISLGVYTSTSMSVDYIMARTYTASTITTAIGSEESYNRAPLLVSRELYPNSPSDYDNLTLKVKCSDADSGDTITAYWNCYKDDVKQNTYSTSMMVANNTNTTVETIDDADTTIGEQWYCGIICGDGEANTTIGNTTVRTIVAGCQIDADCSLCTGWAYLNATESRVLQVRDDDSNGKYDQICCSGTVSEITAL